MMEIGLSHYLVVAAILFTLGVFGIFLNRKNVIIILMSIELILLAVNINLVAFSVHLNDLAGQVFALLVLAIAAAEAAIVPVLSYDYRQLEQDKQAAISYMTPEYAGEYEQLFEAVVAVNAPSTETVVSVEVLESGIVRTGEDLVDVLLFVNRPTTNKQQTTPVIYKDQATVRMRDIGGEWLVDCLIAGSGGTCES